MARRVLLVAHAFRPVLGGVETHLWDLSRELVSRGYRVHCLVGGPPSSEAFSAVTVERRTELTVESLVRRRRGLPLAAVDGGLLADLERITHQTVLDFGPELVHLHNAHHFAPELALALFRRAPLPLVNSVHDRVGEHLYPWVLAEGWKHTIFASHYLAANLPGLGPRSVLWLGIDLSRFRPDGPLQERLSVLERPVVFHPARLLSWKGVEVSVEAFIALREGLGKGSLVLCASTDIVDDAAAIAELRRRLEAHAESAGVRTHLHFHDFDSLEMPSCYRTCDLTWYPTIDEEPLGLVPLEAMACGCPLVVSDSGGMRETVLAGETGLVVPKNDPRALAEASSRVLRDPELRHRLVAAGRARARSFDIASYVNALEGIYGKVCEAA